MSDKEKKPEWEMVDFGPESMAEVHVFPNGTAVGRFGKDWKETDEHCDGCEAQQKRVENCEKDD